jgi:acetoin utilization deacetylase AcuC-like enzyme
VTTPAARAGDAPRTTGFVWDERFLWHDTGRYGGVVPPGEWVEPWVHEENAASKRRVRALLEVSGLAAELVSVAPRPATDEELLRFHTRAYLDRLAERDGRLNSDLGMSTTMGRGSFGIARLAAGGAIEAVDAVLDGRVDNAYALLRPPGHHALADRAMGFCLLGNAVVAGLHALEARGLARIAYVDWDVHHGNGTQAAFRSDPRALTVSVHQDRCFPADTGLLDETGDGAGAGTDVNVPLPPGSGTGAWAAAFERVVVPALERFRPELILVPSGFDGGAYDPMGRMMMTSEGYRHLARTVLAAADRLCAGRVVCTHEGGYHAPTVPFHALAVLETLAGRRTAVEDPFLPIHEGLGQQELQPHQAALLDRVVALHGL